MPVSGAIEPQKVTKTGCWGAGSAMLCVISYVGGEIQGLGRACSDFDPMADTERAVGVPGGHCHNFLQ
jgi:hypothetical protein